MTKPWNPNQRNISVQILENGGWVRLHETMILDFDGISIVLDSGKHRTVTTKRRLN